MTDLEKAQFAAQIFADTKYKGSSVWLIEEVSTRRWIVGQVTNPAEAFRIGDTHPQEMRVYVSGSLSIGNRYDAKEAYLIARGLTSDSNSSSEA